MAKVNITRNEGESEADFRRRYHRAWEDQDRRARGIEPKRKPAGPCSMDGCERAAEIKGLCGNHYRSERIRRMKAEGLNPVGERHAHPLYRIWFERKARGSLCPAWGDFWAFVEAVGERPSPTHLLRRLTTKHQYGPGNWEWLDALSREHGETDAQFHARKWTSRKARFPDFEVGRHLMREFGITQDDYRAILEAQEGVCAICKQPETAKRPTTQTPKALAVDHCHKEGHVRGLLCWRCNSVLGKVGDSIQTLQSMIEYLQRPRRLAG